MKKKIYICFLILVFVLSNSYAQSLSNMNEPPESKQSSSTFWTYSKWIFSGLAVAGLSGRFIYSSSADAALDEYNKATTGSVAESKRGEVESAVNMANTSLIIGAASAFIAAISWILDTKPEAPKQEYLPPKPEEKKEKEKAPTSPPVLASSNIRFTETSGDNFLDAGESGNIYITVINNGSGNAYNLKPKLRFSNPNISYSEPAAIRELKPGESKEIKYTLTTNEKLTDGNTSFELLVLEENGFDLTPSVRISVPTKKFAEPNLLVTDVAIKDNNNNRRIDLAEIVEVTARIQNIGEGMARSVTTDVAKGENVFFTADSKTEFALGNINSGEYKDIVFSFYTNNRATELNLSLNIREQRPAFSKNQKLDLELNKVMKQTEELVIVGQEREKTVIPLATLNIDVDINIPESKIKNKDAVAVVIGNRNYVGSGVPMVEFAIDDANIMKEYLTKTFGFDENQIIYETDATQAKFISTFGTKDNHKGKLFSWVKEGKSDVFIFYSGHGAPDPESKQGYFVPVDCDPSTVALNGYSINTFYDNLSKINYKSLTVVIDACFSGSSDKGMLLKNISPVFITVDNPVQMKENTVVFSSATGDQVSSWYPEKRHSLFTYYFLKALQGEGDLNKDKKLTVGELKEYITEHVPYMARRLNNREQTPQVVGDDETVLVEY